MKYFELPPVFSIYQEIISAFVANRSVYGYSINSEYQFYQSQTTWRHTLDTDGLNDVQYSALEIPLTAVEKQRHPDLLMIPTMAGYVTRTNSFFVKNIG